jgi:hypothetical protein
VAVHLFGRNAEIAKHRRDRAAGMFAGKENRRAPCRIDPFHGIRVARLQQSRRVAVCEAEHEMGSVMSPEARASMASSQRNFPIIVNRIFPFD